MKTSIIKKKSGDWLLIILGNLVLALTFIGFPLAVSISQTLGIESNYVSLLYRSIFIFLASVLILVSIYRSSFSPNFLIILFLLLYLIRILFDLNYSEFDNISLHFQIFIVSVIVPTFAMGALHVWYNERLCLQLIAIFGGIAGLLIAYNLLFQSDESLRELFGGRAALNSLNPISLSYHGLYVAAAAIILIFKHEGWHRLLLWSVIAALGIYLLVAGGSRGPLVSFTLAAALIAFATGRRAGFYMLLGLCTALFFIISGSLDIIFGRFVAFGEDASSIERLELMELSIDAALNNPLLGSGYAEPITGEYPHNLIIEAALALGFVGAGLMIWLQLKLFMNCWTLARRGELLLPLLGCSVLVGAWLSGSIWASGTFFAILWIIQSKVTNGKLLRSTPRPTRAVLNSVHAHQGAR